MFLIFYTSVRFDFIEVCEVVLCGAVAGGFERFTRSLPSGHATTPLRVRYDVHGHYMEAQCLNRSLHHVLDAVETLVRLNPDAQNLERSKRLERCIGGVRHVVPAAFLLEPLQGIPELSELAVCESRLTVRVAAQGDDDDTRRFRVIPVHMVSHVEVDAGRALLNDLVGQGGFPLLFGGITKNYL